MVTIARYNPPEQAENPYAQADEQVPGSQTPSAGGSLSGGLDAAADATAEAATADADAGAADTETGDSDSAAPAEGDATTEGESGSGE